MTVRNYRDLVVWQKAMDFAEGVYHAAQSFPSDQRYGLTRQLQDSSQSIACNIAEGQGYGTARGFLRHLRIARGSLREAETQIILAGRLGFGEREALVDLLRLADEVARLLHRLMERKARDAEEGA